MKHKGIKVKIIKPLEVKGKWFQVEDLEGPNKGFHHPVSETELEK